MFSQVRLHKMHQKNNSATFLKHFLKCKICEIKKLFKKKVKNVEKSEKLLKPTTLSQKSWDAVQNVNKNRMQ